MEQYLGQFLGNVLSSFQGQQLNSTIFSGFVLLVTFTILAYLVFRIALIALKVGTVLGILALVVSMGMPSGDLQANQLPPSENKDPHFSMPDFSAYLSEENLRQIIFDYIKDTRR